MIRDLRWLKISVKMLIQEHPEVNRRSQYEKHDTLNLSQGSGEWNPQFLRDKEENQQEIEMTHIGPSLLSVDQFSDSDDQLRAQSVASPTKKGKFAELLPINEAE